MEAFASKGGNRCAPYSQSDSELAPSAVDGPRVLIVDPSDENRDVLRAALERRGVAILEAGHAAAGLRLAQSNEVDLIVVDLDSVPASAANLPDEFAAATRHHPAPMILLGSMRIHHAQEGGGEFIRKPYHYAPLVRKIEALLAKAA